jgi:hypothetical protein
MIKYFILYTQLLFLVSCDYREEEQQTVSNENVIHIAKNDLGCSYTGAVDVDKVYLFKSNDEVENVVRQIMSRTGLADNFIVKASDVDNACALIKNNQRYILYNQFFMKNVIEKTNSEKAALSILAHEIGHHLNGHTFLNINDEIRIQLELEADRFSGFIMAKFGASLEESLKAIQLFGNNSETSTHPAKKTRIAAITNGFLEASTDQPITPKEDFQDIGSDYIINISRPPLALRNRSLSPNEIRIANSGTPEARKINLATIIADLPNGTPIELLSQVNNTFYIRTYLNNREFVGYIVKKHSGNPTILKFK